MKKVLFTVLIIAISFVMCYLMYAVFNGWDAAKWSNATQGGFGFTFVSLSLILNMAYCRN